MQHYLLPNIDESIDINTYRRSSFVQFPIKLGILPEIGFPSIILQEGNGNFKIYLNISRS